MKSLTGLFTICLSLLNKNVYMLHCLVLLLKENKTWLLSTFCNQFHFPDIDPDFSSWFIFRWHFQRYFARNKFCECEILFVPLTHSQNCYMEVQTKPYRTAKLNFKSKLSKLMQNVEVIIETIAVLQVSQSNFKAWQQ